MKKVLFGAIVILVLIVSLSGLNNVHQVPWVFHFKEINTIPLDVKKIRSSNIGKYAKAVLFEDKTQNIFGVARIEKRFGFLYRDYGYIRVLWDYTEEQGEPFHSSGFSNFLNNDEALTVIKTAKNSNIEYIALGNHMKGVTQLDKYKLTLDDVRKNMDKYDLKEVENNYVLFVTYEYSEDTRTIRAFDKDGNLIADHLDGGAVRYIDWK